jgi:hypothetical protein
MIKNIHRRGRRERRERIRQPAKKQALSSSLAPDSIVSAISMAKESSVLMRDTP